MDREGFEPSKAQLTDVRTVAPFDQLGNLPKYTIKTLFSLLIITTFYVS